MKHFLADGIQKGSVHAIIRRGTTEKKTGSGRSVISITKNNKLKLKRLILFITMVTEARVKI